MLGNCLPHSISIHLLFYLVLLFLYMYSSPSLLSSVNYYSFLLSTLFRLPYLCFTTLINCILLPIKITSRPLAFLFVQSFALSLFSLFFSHSSGLSSLIPLLFSSFSHASPLFSPSRRFTSSGSDGRQICHGRAKFAVVYYDAKVSERMRRAWHQRGGGGEGQQGSCLAHCMRGIMGTRVQLINIFSICI